MKTMKKRGISVLEYAAVLIMIMMGLFLMRRPIARVFMGRFQSMGDSFMHGQQYDPLRTLECGKFVKYDHELKQWEEPIWYEYTCYEDCMHHRNDPCDQGNVSERRECCAQQCVDARCLELEP